MTSTPERQRSLGAFFAAHSAQVQRAVASRARSGSREAIEDACATASAILVRRDDITLDARGLAWLKTVAIHRAWDLLADADHEKPTGIFQGDPRGHDDDDLPEPADPLALTAEDQALDRIEHAADVQAFQQLKPREPEAL